MTTALVLLAAALVVALVVGFLERRRLLLMGLGAVPMWLRPVGSPRWSVGVAWYGGDALLWYRAVSLSVRPQQRLCRTEVHVASRRGPGREDVALPDDAVVLSCDTNRGRTELAMDPSTVTGFLSWVESAPPGS